MGLQHLMKPQATETRASRGEYGDFRKRLRKERHTTLVPVQRKHFATFLARLKWRLFKTHWCVRGYKKNIWE